MNKSTFHKKRYYWLLQLLFLVSFVLLAILGIWAILYEDDMPFLGVLWIVALAIVYWLVKRIFYRIMFGDKIFSNFKES